MAYGLKPQTNQHETIRYDQIKSLIRDLQKGLVERDEAIRLVILAALAGEHLLLIGPPGTAKSLVATRIQHAFKNATYFERLLTKFTVPEELFGPLSIKSLEKDEYHRQTEKYLPTANIAFLDEIFKANSAILNSLLTLINERKFDNGTKREDAPLAIMVAASNELPQTGDLDALYDRFLLRLQVNPVTKEGFKALLMTNAEMMPISDQNKLDNDTLKSWRNAALQKTQLPGYIIKLLQDLKDKLEAENICVSDRRSKKLADLLKISAASNGFDAVQIWDLWVVQHCLWSKPEEKQIIAKWFETAIGIQPNQSIENLVGAVKAKKDAMEKAENAQEQKMTDKGELLFSDNHGRTYALPKGQQASNYLIPINEQKQYYQYEIDHFISSVETTLIDPLEEFLKRTEAQLKTAQKEIDHHLWIDQSLSSVAQNLLEQNKNKAKELVAEAEKILKFINEFPIKSDE